MATHAKILFNGLRQIYKNELPQNFKVLDIGNQNIYGNRDQYLELIKMCQPKKYSVNPDYYTALAEKWADRTDIYTDEVFTSCGAHYESIDMTKEATIRQDLNTYTLDKKYQGKFDLVMNFGTTEHVFNQWNCFNLMHEATKVGGAIWHMLPMQGYTFHSLFKYDAKFFILLASANKYNFIYGGFGDPEDCHKFDQRFESWANFKSVKSLDLRSHLIESIQVKQSNAPFLPPVDLVSDDLASKYEFIPPVRSLRCGLAGFYE